MFNEDNSIKELEEKEPDQVKNVKIKTNFLLNGDIHLNYDTGENKKKEEKVFRLLKLLSNHLSS